MGKSIQLNKTQKIARIILLLVAGFSLTLRIRKMIQLNMIGEEPSGFDWYMLFMWLILIGILAWTLIKQSPQQVESTVR